MIYSPTQEFTSAAEETRAAHFNKLRDYLLDEAFDFSKVKKRWQINEALYTEALEGGNILGWSRDGEKDQFFFGTFVSRNVTLKYTKEGEQYYCEYAYYNAEEHQEAA